MVGMSPLVAAQQATLSLLDARRPTEVGGGPLLSKDDKRIHMRIISGSVCAADRLKEMGVAPPLTPALSFNAAVMKCLEG